MAIWRRPTRTRTRREAAVIDEHDEWVVETEAATDELDNAGARPQSAGPLLVLAGLLLYVFAVVGIGTPVGWLAVPGIAAVAGGFAFMVWANK